MASKKLVPFRATLAWAFLIMLSILGPSVGIGEGSTAIALLVLAIGAVKVRLVGLDFMELRHAPLWMRAAFEAYCAVLWITLSALYLVL